MAELQSCEDSLNKLNSTVNQMLVETGRFFRSSGSMHSRAQLKRVLPVASEEFQTALDRLSEQIYLAKAVLEKDYEPIVREKAVQVSSNAPPTTTLPNESQPPITEAKEEEGKEEEGGNEMLPLDTTDAVQPEAAAEGASAEKLGDGDQAMTTEALQDPTDISAPAEPDPLTTMTDAPAQNEPPAAPSSSQPPDQDTHMTTPADAGPAGLQPGLDLPDAGQDIGQQAFDSLLPGLESYANAGMEDPTNTISQPDLPLDTIAPGENKAPGVDSGGLDVPAEMQVEDMLPQESNFDDLFVGVGDFGDSEDLLKNVEIGEYDSWFT